MRQLRILPRREGTFAAPAHWSVVDEGGVVIAAFAVEDDAKSFLGADAENQRLREALRALLEQTNNIEVLGEWEAIDINSGSRKIVRAKIEKVIAEARAALKGKP